MNRLDNLTSLNHPILACYLPLGDPELLPRQAEIYAEQGVDIFEVGIPCPNPYMDGEQVAGSMHRALVSRVRQRDIAAWAKALRERFTDMAVVMMGYENMCLQQLLYNGKAGFDGFLQLGAADGAVRDLLRAVGVYPIPVVPHDAGDENRRAAQVASGYVMLQAAAGKTGLRREFDRTNRDRIAQLRRCGVTIPILLGIGISNVEHVRQAMACGADGVVIGSACLARAREGELALSGFLQDVRGALDGAN